MLISQGEYRLLERSAFDFGQEIREFLICGQWVALSCLYARVGASGADQWHKARGILAKHRAEASRMERRLINARILLFTGIFYLTGKAAHGNV
jgi:hypothetical protein